MENMAMMLNVRNVAAVREPYNEYLERFRGLEDVIRWAGLIADLDYRLPQAGALLHLLGAAGDEYAGGVASPAEFASISPTDFEETLQLWHYGMDSSDMQRGDRPELSIRPTAIVKGRARAAQRCT